MPYSTQILSAGVEFHSRPFVKPLKLSSGEIHHVTEAQAQVRVRVNGREAIGQGAIYLSDLWAWPHPILSHEQRDESLRALCREIAASLGTLCSGENTHPLELGLRLHHSLGTAESPIPLLARAMCGSPFDAAIHDAVGQALQISAFDLYDEPFAAPSADPFFDGTACTAIRSLIQSPRSALNAWLIVGAGDSLEVEIAPWVQKRGYSGFKLKLGGRDNAADAARTAEIFQGARKLGVEKPRLSVDTNEANPDAASVLDYLERLRALDPEAFAALEYLEQPTGRDIHTHAFDWHPVTRLKPVLIDEGLTDLELFDLALSQGWSGFALKTCKGHSFALVAAAWAKQRGLLLTMQDLTNPGLAAIHSALFAAHIPSWNGVEMNSPQYTPAANSPWLPRLQSMLEPQDGMHRLPDPHPVGLGSTL